MPKFDVTAVQIVRQTIIYEVNIADDQTSELARQLVEGISDKTPLSAELRQQISFIDVEDEVVLDTLVCSVEPTPANQL